MKHSKELMALLGEVKQIHDPKVKVRLHGNAVKELSHVCGFQSGVATASLAILSKLVTQFPVSFEDRAAVNRVLELSLNAESNKTIEITEGINELLLIIKKYQE